MSIEQAEELLRLLPQVTGCRIRSDETGAPVAVLITAAPGSRANAVLADVITVLGAQAGLDVLEDQVHVVVLEEGPPALQPQQPRDGGPDEEAASILVEALEYDGRAELLSYAVEVSGERTRARVEVALGERPFWGESESRGAGEVPELLAEACLDALERACHGRVALRLAAWKRGVLGTVEIVTVLVQESSGRQSRWLVGAAPVEGDPARAAAHAALDGMNRRLGRILARPPVDFDIHLPES